MIATTNVIRHEARDFERFPLANLLRRADPGLHRQCIQVQEHTRQYCDRHLRPHVEAWDQLAGRDHDFVPWAAIDAGLPYGFFGMNVPAIFGGGHLGPVPAAVFAEEISSVDAGMFVVFGAHGLAWSLILGSCDMRIIDRVGREIAEGERTGRPVILALAHTEETGGSDVEDVDDIRKARLPSRYTKVPGGYRVSARKVFCSNGPIAKTIVLSAYGDPRRPLETMRAFLLPAGTPGLGIGRPEHKMGQRLSTATEVSCDDLFVPDEDAIELGDGGRVIDTTLTLTRGMVGAMSAGILRGTLERTLAYLAHRQTEDPSWRREQWIDLVLADMVASLQAARGLYLDAAFACEEWGYAQLLRHMPSHVPAAIAKSGTLRSILGSTWLSRELRARYATEVPVTQLQRVVAHASIAKYQCSDMAVDLAMKAMEILGEDANDPRWGVEKCLRDAKLAQIFEGTNQINRLHVVRGLLARA